MDAVAQQDNLSFVPWALDQQPFKPGDGTRAIIVPSGRKISTASSNNHQRRTHRRPAQMHRPLEHRQQIKGRDGEIA